MTRIQNDDFCQWGILKPACLSRSVIGHIQDNKTHSRHVPLMCAHTHKGSMRYPFDKQ